MKCLACSKTDFSTKNVRFSPEIKGETVELILPCFVCDGCGETLMDSAQMNALRRASADAYRKNHGLLTSHEIIALRTGLGMSQTEFARYLKVGDASIKRWETYFVQDESQDEHLRLKCDENTAELNTLKIYWEKGSESILNGNRKFNFELFKNTLLALIKYCKSPLFVNKAMFYADFYHYKKYAVGLTGSKYVKLDYGPCPDQYQLIFKYLKNMNIFEQQGQHDLIPVLEADFSIFSDSERETVEAIIGRIKNDNGRLLYDMAHIEEGFLKTRDLDIVSYSYAANLKIG